LLLCFIDIQKLLKLIVLLLNALYLLSEWQLNNQL